VHAILPNVGGNVLVYDAIVEWYAVGDAQGDFAVLDDIQHVDVEVVADAFVVHAVVYGLVADDLVLADSAADDWVAVDLAAADFAADD